MGGVEGWEEGMGGVDRVERWGGDGDGVEGMGVENGKEGWRGGNDHGGWEVMGMRKRGW